MALAAKRSFDKRLDRVLGSYLCTASPRHLRGRPRPDLHSLKLPNNSPLLADTIRASRVPL